MVNNARLLVYVACSVTLLLLVPIWLMLLPASRKISVYKVP